MMRFGWAFFALCLARAGDAAAADDIGAVRQDPCGPQETCSACLQRDPICSWCYQPDYSRPRCFSQDALDFPCDEQFVYSPDSMLEILQDNRANMTDQPHRFRIALSRHEDPPLDLYYLMDTTDTASQAERRSVTAAEAVVAVGAALADACTNLTTSVRFGVGSVAPHGAHPPFFNDCPLDLDTQRFVSSVERVSVKPSPPPPPETGALDALISAAGAAEAAAASLQVGWRPSATKLLLYVPATHFSDHRVLNNLTAPGGSIPQYYEPVAAMNHLNDVLKQNSIKLIVAVTREQLSVYERLRDHIEGASVGLLGDIVQIVEEQYNKSSIVEMKDNSNGDVNIKYRSSCLGGGIAETNRCNGPEVGGEVQFDVEITVMECPTNRSQWTRTLQIYPVGVKESLTVELKMLCDCPCEHPGHPMYQEHSPSCSGVGVSACGVCRCEPGQFGRHCECSGGGAGGTELANACRPLNSTGGVECSGRGTCVCGQCECETLPNPDEFISGQFCECDNFSCDRHNNTLCSGSEHGTCVCGQCMCMDGWSGPACSQISASYPGGSELANACRPYGSGVVCSGRGTCVGGQCECETLPNPDEFISGQFCECDNFSCDRHNNTLCSGSEHGTCVCGQCMCMDGWSGPACSQISASCPA